MEELATQAPTVLPTEETPRFNEDACAFFEPADIEAAALGEFPVGEPHAGNDVPLALGEANSCSWEFGNPEAQFHERLYLYVFKLEAGENPENAFDGQARRMSNANEPTTSIGDRTVYSQRTGSLLVLEDGFLFYLRADTLNATEETEDKVIELAKLVLERK
jgi:hypothetical protein